MLCKNIHETCLWNCQWCAAAPTAVRRWARVLENNSQIKERSWKNLGRGVYYSYPALKLQNLSRVVFLDAHWGESVRNSRNSSQNTAAIVFFFNIVYVFSVVPPPPHPPTWVHGVCKLPIDSVRAIGDILYLKERKKNLVCYFVCL